MLGLIVIALLLGGVGRMFFHPFGMWGMYRRPPMDMRMHHGPMGGFGMHGGMGHGPGGHGPGRF